MGQDFGPILVNYVSLRVYRSIDVAGETSSNTTVVEIVYIELIDLIDLDCSRKLLIVVNVSLLT